MILNMYCGHGTIIGRIKREDFDIKHEYFACRYDGETYWTDNIEQANIYRYYLDADSEAREMANQKDPNLSYKLINIDIETV